MTKNKIECASANKSMKLAQGKPYRNEKETAIF